MSNDDEATKKQLKILIEAAVDDAFLNEESVMYKAFIEPFTDVIQTARAGLEASLSSVTSNARKVGMQVAAAAIPFIAPAEVTRLGADENARLKERLAAIDGRYADVLDRTKNALQNKDFAGTMFLLNPAVALGAHAGAWAAGKGTAGASDLVASNLEFLSILTAHVPVVGKLVGDLSGKFSTLSQKASDFAGAVVNKPVGDAGFSGGGGAGAGDDFGGDFGEAVVHRPGQKLLKESFTTDQLVQKMGSTLQKVLARKDVQQAIASSPIIKAVKTSGVESVMDRAKKVASFTTLDQFKQFAGPEFSKYEEQLRDKMPPDATPEVLKEFEASQVASLKKVYKGIYAKYLKELAGKTSGVSEEISAAQQVINKLG